VKVSPGYRLLLFWIVLILYGSFFPFHFRFHHIADYTLFAVLHAWPAHLDRFVTRDLFVNVTLYVPLGVFWQLARERDGHRNPVVPVVGGFFLSSFVEVGQLLTQTRTASLLDVACNTAGTVIGVAFARAGSGRLHRFETRVVASQVFRPSANLLLLACWVGYQLAPVFPAFSRTKVAAKIAFLASPDSMTFVATAIAWTEWLAVAWVFAGVWGYDQTGLFALLLLLPVRLFLEGRMMSWSEVVGGILALTIWSVALKGAANRTRIVAAVLIAGIVLDGLRPFHFSSARSEFLWQPFGGTLMAEREFALPEVLRKTFVYGASIWLLEQSGLALTVSALAVAAGLGAIEIAQLYLPGRTAEVTDPLLALGVAYALWLATRARSRVPSDAADLRTR